MVMIEARRYPDLRESRSRSCYSPTWVALGTSPSFPTGPEISVPCHLRVHGIVQRLCAEYDLAPESN